MVGEVGEVGVYFGGAHVFWVAFVVVEDVFACPIKVGAFGAQGVAAGAEFLLHSVEEFGGRFLLGHYIALS